MPLRATSLSFREQAEFFRNKLNMPTEAWTDIFDAEHDWAFMVAGANRNEIVADFRQAVDRVITEGVSLEEFRQDFDRIVAERGWSFNGGRNWRSRIIYETNLNSSYQAGRFNQLMELREDRPFWEYVHSDAVTNPRQQHLAWDGLVLRWDDPWWDAHFPTNGWGCQCRVIARAPEDLERLGKSGPDTAPPVRFEDITIGQRSPGGPRTVRVPEGIDPSFAHTPGRSRLSGAMPPPGAGPGSSPPAPAGGGLPTARPFTDTRLLSPTLTDDEVINRFLSEFDAEASPQIFRDAAGEALVIGRELFTDPASGAPRPPLPDGKPNTLMLADAIREPDEIRARLVATANGRSLVRRRYLARFTQPGASSPVAAFFELGRDGWRAEASTEIPDEDLRQGELLFRREE